MSPHDTLPVETIREEAGPHVRSVIYYERGGFDLEFVREDAEAEYTEEHVEAVVDELGVESIERRIKEDLYPHGQLKFTVLWFEQGIELFIHTDERAGIAVGLDPEAFEEEGPFTDELVAAVGP